MIQKLYANLSDKGKIIFNVAVVFVVLAFLDRLFLGPVMNRLNSIDEEIALQENSIIRDLRFLSYKDYIIEESNIFGKFFTDELSDDDVINADFLSVVEQIASQNKVNLIKSNPTESKRSKDYLEYFANLDCVGQLKDVISFMHSINSTDELLKIVRFTMTPKRGTEGEVTASMTIVKLIVPSQSQ